MRRQELGVEQAIAAEPEPRDEMNERHLACIGMAAEHALAEKNRADRDAVEPAGEVATALIQVFGRFSVVAAQPRTTSVKAVSQRSSNRPWRKTRRSRRST